MGSLPAALLVLLFYSADTAQAFQTSPSPLDHHPQHLLIKLKRSQQARRFYARPLSQDVAGQLADRLGGDSISILFPMDGEAERHSSHLRRDIPNPLPKDSRSLRLARRARFGLDRWIIFTLRDHRKIEDEMLRLRGNPLVEVVEPDFTGTGETDEPLINESHGSGRILRERYSPDDPRLDEQWYLEQANDADIDAFRAWDICRNAFRIPVAVMDSGADLDHPDLEPVLQPGYDFVNNDAAPNDDHGHGTNVTGLLGAAADNGIGVAGIAFTATIIPIKILDNNNTGYYSWWASGFVYAADLGVRVINISAGGSGNSSALHDAVRYAHDKGVVICACMHNQNSDTPIYPAAFEETIAVGATNKQDRRADPFSWGGGSNYGEHIDLVAPGNRALSTARGGSYSSWSGTSQATPLVSGVAALILARNTGLTNEEVRTILRDTAEDQVGDPAEDTPGFDIYYGAGRLNAADALRNVPAETVPLSATIDIEQDNFSSELIEIILVPSTALGSIPEISVSGQPLSVEARYDAEGQFYSADFSIPAPGKYTVSAYLTDPGGIDTTITSQFSTNSISSATGGIILSPDEILKMIIEPNTLSDDRYLIINQQVPGVDWDSSDYISPGVNIKTGIGGESRITRGISSVYSIVPEGLNLNRNARLRLSLTVRGTDTVIMGRLGIYRWDDYRWIYEQSYLDETESEVEIFIDRLGKYQLRDSTQNTGLGISSGLGQNYPNPFNNMTNIRYRLTGSSWIDLYIVNVRSQRVRTLSYGYRDAGQYIDRWDGRSFDGRALPSGIYIVVLEAQGRVFSRKLMLIK